MLLEALRPIARPNWRAHVACHAPRKVHKPTDLHLQRASHVLCTLPALTSLCAYVQRPLHDFIRIAGCARAMHRQML